MRTRLETTNSVDDWCHRGPYLRWMDLWAYHMFVRRTRARAGQMPDVIPFEHHYALARAYAQEVRYDFAIPRIHGLQCPTLAQDAEGNAMMKAILFGLVECQGPGFCNHVARFRAILGLSLIHI